MGDSTQRRATSGPAQIRDLRAGLRAVSGEAPPKPPKPARNVRRETDDERAERAERLALAQHSTSLLKGEDSGKPYLRPGERAPRKAGAGMFLLQLACVVGIAGGVAWALDPSLVPAEWTDGVRALVGQYVKI